MTMFINISFPPSIFIMTIIIICALNVNKANDKKYNKRGQKEGLQGRWVMWGYIQCNPYK